MKEHRHPHPHVDPRQPRNETKPGTNPPVFAWKPIEGGKTFRLTIARDAAFSDVCLDPEELTEPLYLPDKAFEPGRYFWKWSAGADESEVFTFEITPESVVLEVPPADEWLKRFPAQHPRLYVRPEEVEALRKSRHGERATLREELRTTADAILAESHELAEPPFLPDRKRDYQAFFKAWYPVLWNSRRFIKNAEILAFAFLASGEEKYARAACRRMASVSRWDPEGSSNIWHNDEAHMSIIWDGSKACDWVWDRFTDEERARVIEQFRRRGQITYAREHDQGSYGVTHFGSHAGREIVFLALLALVFHEHVPEARTWLDWLRPILCGIWPIWAGDDGGWAEGPSYGLAYVKIMTMFASALKRGAGVDLYRRPFWRNHALWRQYSWPPYAEWFGFGDHSERWELSWKWNADLVELIGHEAGTNAFADYVAAFRSEAAQLSTPPERALPLFSALRYLSQPAQRAQAPRTGSRTLRVFPHVGWAAMRTHLDDPSRDIALIFRSSPFGAISHSHANNNDFIIHVAGKAMAMPSGYYDGYAANHHAHWARHTKAHNCVTLSDAPQILYSPDSHGAIENDFEDDRLVYFRGNADESYGDRAARCRRHVIFLKRRCCFVMIDEYVPRPGNGSALQWNIHSWNRFAVDEPKRSFLLERDGSTLEGHFMYHSNAFFSLSEGWDPPPMRVKDSSEWHQQYHLRFTTSGYRDEKRNLSVVLCPGHALLPPAKVSAERVEETEVARIGEDLVLIKQDDVIAHEDIRTDALALLIVEGESYEVRDEGLVCQR